MIRSVLVIPDLRDSCHAICYSTVFDHKHNAHVQRSAIVLALLAKEFHSRLSPTSQPTVQAMASPTPSSPERPLKRPRTSRRANNSTEAVRDGAACPYMDTVTPSTLDFDLPPTCSISLQSHNVYICLICGKYLQGRSPSSHAYAHSLHVGHHLYLSVSSETVYCLPDGYQVIDPSFRELISALHPKFAKEDIAELDVVPVRIRVLDGSLRLRGVVPLDNLHAIDYANSVFQLLLRPPPVRDLLLKEYAGTDIVNSTGTTDGSTDSVQSELASALAALCAKLWASQAYRAHVAPHELMQLVSRASKGRFGLLKQADPFSFMAWLLNSFGWKRGAQLRSPSHLSSLVEKCFRGEMEVQSVTESGDVKKTSSLFWFLPLDLPPKPLFQDASERTLVPQVPLSKLLLKFDGVSRHHDVKSGEQRMYRIRKFPPYLLLVVRRFAKSKFGIEKNPCVVHLPAEGLDVSSLCEGDGDERYSLIAAILHEGTAKDGKYRIVVRHDATSNWYDLSDMAVKPTLEQLVSLADTYILLYARPVAV